jgi:hypothetical protein
MFEWIALSVICILLIGGFVAVGFMITHTYNWLAPGIKYTVDKVASISSELQDIQSLLERRLPEAPARPRDWE